MTHWDILNKENSNMVALFNMSQCVIRDFKIHYGEVLLRRLRPSGTRVTTANFAPNSND